MIGYRFLCSGFVSLLCKGKVSSCISFSFYSKVTTVIMASPVPTSSSSSTTTTTTITTMMTKRHLFLPTIIQSKKRKVATVQRTHSPKRATQRQESKRIAPCVLGIQRGAQIMKQGQVLAIPTETVYVLCTCVRLDKIGDGLCQCKSISVSHSTTSLISDTI